MQKIDRPGRYVARWGPYTIVLDSSADCCRAEVRRTDDQSLVAATTKIPLLTWREAIKWSADQLAVLGCSTFVNGKPRNLADFLAFERMNAEQQDGKK